MNRKGKKEERPGKESSEQSTQTPHHDDSHESIQNQPGEASEDETDTQSPGVGNTDQVAELNDKYLRLYSEFDNYRRRTLKEKIEQSKYASAEVITRLLPVVDDFERAIKAFDSMPESVQPAREGTLLIYQKLMATLNQQGLEAMRAEGETFDTDFHEALTNIPAPSPELKGKIVDVIEKGYMLHGKVIRFAKVVVGS